MIKKESKKEVYKKKIGSTQLAHNMGTSSNDEQNFNKTNWDNNLEKG